MTNKIENQCTMCDNMANGEILDLFMIDMMEVCDDCYKEVFQEVANEGKSYFFEWATEMFGDTGKVEYLTNMIYGEGSADEMKADRSETMMMFTYGILKWRHNLEREGAITIVENSTIKGHKIHLYGNSFPITRKTGNDNDIVYGTLFEIPKYVVLSNYDIVESYSPHRKPEDNMYNREEIEVTTPNGEVVMAQMYYANQEQFARHLTPFTEIPTGNFDDKHLAQSFHYYNNLRTKRARTTR
jgi:gamma-glutamylcyclotransferase (GGCT)/AIG2-like uncharacterized protein YtfP